MNNIEYYHFLLGSSNNSGLNVLYYAPLEVPYCTHNNTNQIVMGMSERIIKTKMPKSSYNPDTNIGLWEFDSTDFDYKYYANMGIEEQQSSDSILIYFLGDSFNLLSEEDLTNLIQIQNSINTISNITFSNNWEYIEFYTNILDFRFFTNLESVTLPNNLKGVHLELTDSKVKKITLPSTVEEVNLSGNLITTVQWNASLASISKFKLPKLTSIIFGPDVKVIPQYICSNSTPLLENITIPGTVQTIDSYAISECNIKTINIENGVQSIGILAYSCPHLTSITIPSSVKNINSSLYYSSICYDCPSLTSVTINSKAIMHSIDEDGPNSIQMSNLFGPQVTEYIIGDNVQCIGSHNFYENTSLTSVIIGNNVLNIEYVAFDGCSSLTSVTIGNSVKSIEYRAFAGCSSLTSITIPNSVISIGDSAFAECSSLTSINYTGTIEQWGTITKGSLWHDEVPATYIQCTDGQITIS